MTNVPIYLVVGSPAECINYYMVEYKLTSEGGFTRDADAYDSPIELTQLQDNATYNVRITPFCCNGQYGTPLEIIIDTTPSDVPTTFTATPGDGEVILTWDIMPGAINYVIDRALDAGFTTGLIEIFNGNADIVSDTAVTNGTTYYYRIRGQYPSAPDSAYAYDNATPNP